MKSLLSRIRKENVLKHAKINEEIHKKLNKETY